MLELMQILMDDGQIDGWKIGLLYLTSFAEYGMTEMKWKGSLLNQPKKHTPEPKHEYVLLNINFASSRLISANTSMQSNQAS